MKAALVLAICISSLTAHAGYFVEKGGYNDKYILVGRGKTIDAARADAMSAMPKETYKIRYDLDQANAPQFQCMNGEPPSKDLKICKAELGQMTIPLLRVER